MPVGGALNLPAYIGGHHALDHWLEPALEPAYHFLKVELPPHATELMLVAVAVLVALTGLVLGFRRTLASGIVPAREAPPETGLARVLYHKYWVDEFYQALIVRPLVALSGNIARHTRRTVPDI